MSWIDEMEERFICFSAAVCIEISKQSNDYAMINLKQQIIRAATSVSLNYAEARAAESSKDFIHKLKLALKELNETKVGLKLAAKIDANCTDDVSELLPEAGELTGILLASIRTARENLNKS